MGRFRSSENEACVGVFPSSALDAHAWVLSALEAAFGVRFLGCDSPDRASLDGLVMIGARPPARPPVTPCLVLPAADGPLSGPSTRGTERVTLSRRDPVPPALRGRELDEVQRADVTRDAASGGVRVLASTAGGALWWQQADGAEPVQISVYPLPRLAAGVLRDHFQPGRFMGLLPLVSLLQRVREGRLSQPPLRACIVFDDPNLHRLSYGHIDYRRLAAHARSGGYHVAFATIPLDGWRVKPRVASLLRDHQEQISLCIHGNDHSAHELGRLHQEATAERVIAQALRRIESLESRSGLDVDRVMVPPHERCSEQALRAMLALGVEAACMSRPHPWRDHLDPASPLLGWRAEEFVAGGLPVLPRHPLSFPPDELLFRAVLGQPLIVYGHHDYLAGGYAELERLVEFVNGIGDVSWTTLAGIARANYSARTAGPELSLEVSCRREVVDHRLVPRPRPRAWPIVRRLFSEQRVRAQTTLRRHPRGHRGSAQRVVMLLENNPYPHDTRVRNEAETLAAAGHEVTVLAPYGPGEPPREDIGGVRVRRYHRPTAGGSLGAFALEYAVAHAQLLMRSLRELAGGAQVVHMHGPPDTLAIVGVAARIARRSVVFDLHDSGPELFTAKFGESPLRHALVIAQRAAIACANRVIVTNESQRDIVLARASGRPNVSIIRNGPRAAEFGPLDCPPRTGRLEAPRLVYVGALDVQDGALDLVELLAMPELAVATLTIVGDGPLAPELRARAAQAGVAERLRVTGWLPHATVPEAIAACDIGVDPAPGTELNHGSSMIKISEYLAAGRPVVAYRLRETERTAGAAALYAPCGDPTEMARLVRRLCDEPQLRAELSEEARTRGRELAWENSAEPLRRVYAELT